MYSGTEGLKEGIKADATGTPRRSHNAISDPTVRECHRQLCCEARENAQLSPGSDL